MQDALIFNLRIWDLRSIKLIMLTTSGFFPTIFGTTEAL